MNKMQSRNNGQSTLEYTLLIAAFIAAIILMKGYATRAISGRLHEASNSISEQHYLPGEMTSEIKTTVTGETATITQMDSFVDPEDPGQRYQGLVTHVITNEVTTKSGWEKSGPIFKYTNEHR